MPRKKKTRKTGEARRPRELQTDRAQESYAELYPDFPARIREIWNSDSAFIREKVAFIKAVFERREESRGDHLCRRFGLTPAEARIAVYIFEGGSVSGYAEQAGRSELTVRTHLKSVFRKTGISRQAELATLFVPSSL